MGSAQDKPGVRERFAKVFLFAKNGLSRTKEF